MVRGLFAAEVAAKQVLLSLDVEAALVDQRQAPTSGHRPNA